jgi:uncharacterized protein (DUF2126 family)
MILLWGMSGDEPLTAILGSLRRRRAHFAFLDQRDILETTVELAAGPTLGGHITVRGRAISLDPVTAVYTRLYEAYRLPHVLAGGEEAATHASAVESALWSWQEVTAALTVNRPSAMASNASKPYQSAIIRAAGFFVPPTLVTTDPAAALEFWERHGEVIYKSVSCVRSIVSRLKPDGRERLADIVHCPTQFQGYVPGRDYRVHVIGDDVFPVEVISGADDYRYAGRQGSTLEMRACRLPDDVEARCRALAARLEFHLAGIDLRRTPEGQWYCFEVNPSPCFTFYQEQTGQPLSETLAQLLLDAPRPSVTLPVDHPLSVTAERVAL